MTNPDKNVVDTLKDLAENSAKINLLDELELEVEGFANAQELVALFRRHKKEIREKM